MILIIVFPSFKKYSERLKEYLEMENFEIIDKILIYTKELPDNERMKETSKISFIVIEKKFNFFFYTKKLIKKYIKDKSNIIIVNHFVNITPLSKKYKKNNIKVITKLYSPNLLLFFRKGEDVKIKYKPFLLFFKRSIMDIFSVFFSDIIIGNSEEIELLMNKVIKFFHIRRKIFTIPTSTDTDFYFFNKRDLSEEEFKILFVGNLVERKGIIDTIEVLSQLKKEKIEFKMFFAGTSYKDLKEKIFSKIDKYNLRENVSFLGFIKKGELRNCYHNSDLLLFPSYYEGSPRVIKEAMSCGLPVVCYDISGTRLIDPEGKVIEFVKKGDLNELKRLTRSLLIDTNRRKKISEAGSILVKKNFSIRKISELHIDLLKSFRDSNN